ncbi:MAG: TlpA family protein disulfide reductase [Deltaproteobacteria bacterium]|nr:TlpA family protein disulfide reductase [Deltaproteobacteria bacterium]
MRHISTYLVVGLALAACTTTQPVPPTVKPGDARLNLTLANYPGPGESNLGALGGKVVLIDFWATWCGPCHEAAVAYEKLYQAHKADGFVVYGVSLDDEPSGIDAFLKEQGVTYPIVLDPSGAKCASRFELATIPAALLVDRSGHVRFAHSGYSDEEVSKTESEIKQLLAEPAPVQ